MDVLLTGAHGRVGESIKRHIAAKDEYDFTYLDRVDHPEYETVVADVADYDAIRPAFDGQDAVIHLAAYPETDGTWEQIHTNSLIGTHNALEAASDAGVGTFVYASSIHTVGVYEIENAPEIYELGFDMTIDHTMPVRPDSYYGASKVFGEAWGRYYIEMCDYPEQFYAIRIASVRWPQYDHPYRDAEEGVEEGWWERGSDKYEEQVKRLKGTWLSQRDSGQLHQLCLQDETVDFDIFYGRSDNERSWYDIEHAREVLGYDPQDRGEDWDGPPESPLE